MRDELIELIKRRRDPCDIGACPFTVDDVRPCSLCETESRATTSYPHGVTFAEDNNVGCKYCKEDKDGYRAMFGAFSLYNPFHGSEWLIQTGHFKPRQIYFCPMCGRKLTEPPKEGE